MIKAIIAMDQNGLIGSDGKLPWPHHPDDLTRFRRLTISDSGILVMGRKTADGLLKPLDLRKNLVLTRNHHYTREGFETIHHLGGITDAWIIGGAEVYRLTEIFWKELYLTVFNGCGVGDTTYTIDMKFWKLDEEPIQYDGPFTACTYFHYVRY